MIPENYYLFQLKIVFADINEIKNSTGGNVKKRMFAHILKCYRMKLVVVSTWHPLIHVELMTRRGDVA